MDNYKQQLGKAINTAFLLLIPVTAAVFILSEPAVMAVYEGGNFDHTATIKTAQTLAMYSIGIVAIGLRDILTRAFYSLHDTKTPLINSFIAILINIILNLILIGPMAQRGLALATSISAIISSAILIYNLDRKVGLNFKSNIIIGLKSTIAAVIMSIFIYSAYPYILEIINSIRYAQIISILLSVIIGAVLYGAVIRIMRIRMTDFIDKKL
jgi:putative peptidoglycan lipid II flippase